MLYGKSLCGGQEPLLDSIKSSKKAWVNVGLDERLNIEKLRGYVQRTIHFKLYFQDNFTQLKVQIRNLEI